MKLFLHCTFIFLLLSLPYLPALAQEEPVKFGKVEATDFDKSTYKGADTAPAVVLCDFGRSRIEGAEDGFRVVFERVTRVLIVGKAGYEHATVQVPLYRHNNQEESLQKLRGWTYNLVNGRVEKQKLDDGAIFKEQLDTRHALRKFTMPNVREGSIIEYAYTIKSDFLFNLQDWQFQHDIPVVWSEYRTEVPAFFVYKEIPHGYHPYAVQDRKLVPYSTAYRESSRDGYGASISGNTKVSNIRTQALSSRWVMKDVPALMPEPFMTTTRDYLASLDFELHLIQFDPSSPQPITSTWEKINSELLKNEHFGELLSDRSPLAAAAAALATRYPEPAARAAAVMGLVQQAARYNGEERLYATTSLRRVLEQKQGNSAELNLLLVHTLRDAGLEAAPLLVSTRRNGRVQTELPMVSQFNYVVARVELPNQQQLLLDATEPMAAPGTLPERCLNGQGRLISAPGRWVPLAPSQKYLHLINARLTLTEQGQLQGNVRTEYGGYAGINERSRLAEAGEKAYFTKLREQHPDWQLTRSAVQHTEELATPLLVDVDLTVPMPEASAGKLYLPLMQPFTDARNPFQNDKRTFPVDFATAREQLTTLLVTLPAGYSVVELPAKLQIELPNGDGQYVYEVTQQGNTLRLISRLQLRKAEFRPSEYAALRELFARSVAKHAEPLVLQKK